MKITDDVYENSINLARVRDLIVVFIIFLGTFLTQTLSGILLLYKCTYFRYIKYIIMPDIRGKYHALYKMLFCSTDSYMHFIGWLETKNKQTTSKKKGKTFSSVLIHSSVLFYKSPPNEDIRIAVWYTQRYFVTRTKAQNWSFLFGDVTQYRKILHSYLYTMPHNV